MQTARPRTPMSQLWSSIQSWLFPMLEDEIGELDERHRQFVAVCELCAPQDHMDAYRWCGNGCPPRDRLALCKAFIAKAVWDFATTRDLIDAFRHRPALRRLCGWESLGEVPSEATFSRAFDAFRRTRRTARARARSVQGGRPSGFRPDGHRRRADAQDASLTFPGRTPVPQKPPTTGR